jgi:hypothetical protein
MAPVMKAPRKSQVFSAGSRRPPCRPFKPAAKAQAGARRAPTVHPGGVGLLQFVRLSSERARQAVRQDCSLPKKQESPPPLLVIVRGDSETGDQAS